MMTVIPFSTTCEISQRIVFRKKTDKGTPPQILFLWGFPGKAVYNFKEELVDILDRIFDIALLLVRARWDDVGILIIRGRLNKLEK